MQKRAVLCGWELRAQVPGYEDTRMPVGGARLPPELEPLQKRAKREQARKSQTEPAPRVTAGHHEKNCIP